MKHLKHLNNGSLLALKTALDAFQRYENQDPVMLAYFKKIIHALIGPLTDINVWAIRTAINEEDERRSKQASIWAANPEVHANLSRLGKQELQVLKLVGQGFRNQEIADLLSIDIRTAVNHKQHITTKLALGTTKDLHKFAVANLAIL